MTTTRDHELTTTLRTLDPATHADARSPQARLLLEQVLASDPGTVPAGPTPAPRTTPHRRRLVAAVVVAAAACTAVVLPATNGGDPAFATWSPTPEELSPAARADAAESCRDAQRDGAGSEHADALAAARVAVSERRGAWTTVVLTGPGGLQALCVSDSSTRFFDDMFGSVGVPDVAAPGPRDVVATDLGIGSVDGSELSLAAGLVGPDVREVSYESSERGRVQATVSRGQFALWLPGDELEEGAAEGVRVRVTHTDGTSSEAVLRL